MIGCGCRRHTQGPDQPGGHLLAPGPLLPVELCRLPGADEARLLGRQEICFRPIKGRKPLQHSCLQAHYAQEGLEDLHPRHSSFGGKALCPPAL